VTSSVYVQDKRKIVPDVAPVIGHIKDQSGSGCSIF
jgi:hypothetical protein